MEFLPFAEAVEHFGQKAPTGSPWSSAQWAAQAPEIRNRAFFIAKVEEARLAQSASDFIGNYLTKKTETLPNGQTILKAGGKAQFVQEFRAKIRELGLDDGSPINEKNVRDLRSRKRAELIFDTQTRMAYGYGQYAQGMHPAILDAFPAWRFVRNPGAKIKRARHAESEGAVRLKTDVEYWAHYQNSRMIGGFENPYPPFGFNSYMDVLDVDRAEAESLGLLDKKQPVPKPKTPQRLNQGMKASTNGMNDEIKKKLKTSLGASAIEQGDFLELLQKPGPPGIPVSRSVSIKSSNKIVKESAALALKLIDEVHGDGELPEIVVDKTVSKTTLGFYMPFARKLAINPKGKWPGLTAVHELGHHIQMSAIPESFLMEFATEAVKSQSIKEIVESRKMNSKFKTYFLSLKEVWARAYAQYIAVETQDETLLEQLSKILQGDEPWRQWEAADFEPIRKQITLILQKKGWK